MVLQITSYDEASGRVQAHAAFSGGLGGEGDLNRKLRGNELVLDGVLEYSGNPWKMSAKGTLNKGTISGTYTVMQGGRPGSLQAATSRML